MGHRGGDESIQQLLCLPEILHCIEEGCGEHAVSGPGSKPGQPARTLASRQQHPQGHGQGIGWHEEVVKAQAKSSKETGAPFLRGQNRLRLFRCPGELVRDDAGRRRGSDQRGVEHLENGEQDQGPSEHRKEDRLKGAVGDEDEWMFQAITFRYTRWFLYSTPFRFFRSARICLVVSAT